MNYRKIIETAIECERLEARLNAFMYCQRHQPNEDRHISRKIEAIRGILADRHSQLKQLVEETE